MPPINPTPDVTAVILEQIAALRRSRQKALKPAPGADVAQTGAGSEADLSTQVAPRIAAIALDDPERERKAFRIYLERALLSEFGAHLVNDPTFPQMVEHVQKQMESDATLKPVVRDVARALLKSK